VLSDRKEGPEEEIQKNNKNGNTLIKEPEDPTPKWTIEQISCLESKGGKESPRPHEKKVIVHSKYSSGKKA